jgi:hypothetical protein
MNPALFLGQSLLAIFVGGAFALIIFIAILRAVFSIGKIVELLEDIRNNTEKNQSDPVHDLSKK